jgi:hypothetical protein
MEVQLFATFVQRRKCVESFGLTFNEIKLG